MKILFISLFLLVTVLSEPDPDHSKCIAQFFKGYVPSKMLSSDVGICKNNYTAISYNGDLVNPSWSAYAVTKAEAKSVQGGRKDFVLDDDLTAMGVNQARADNPAFSDEWNRGHLAPSNIMSYDKNPGGPWYMAYEMSNIAVQSVDLNQRGWEALEQDLVAYLAGSGPDLLYIITGTIINDPSNPNRSYGLSVPDYYFKVVCDPFAKSSIGFYGKNISGNTAYPTKATVDEIEKMYGGSLMDSACNTDKVDDSHWWSI